MDQPDIFFKGLYKNFNNRNIDAVIAIMTDDVKWANGMDGGFVYGHKGVREYWTRQFTVVSANVTPVKIAFQNGVATIQVHQVVHDLNQQLLADEIVEHLFFLKDDKIAEFNIGEKIKPLLPAKHE
jgi:SnoaL-like domain